LTSVTGRAVHSKTLNNALRYLTGNDLVVRRGGAMPNTVVYEITEFGRGLLRIFEDADQAFERHLQNGDPRSPRGQDT
jgi:DNA-binding HxlR family transcriptional regulator